MTLQPAWLITYQQRRPGVDWIIANAVTDETVVDWLIRHKQNVLWETVILFAIPISQAEFKQLGNYL